jgi:hypothetical protein
MEAPKTGGYRRKTTDFIRLAPDADEGDVETNQKKRAPDEPDARWNAD